MLPGVVTTQARPTAPAPTPDDLAPTEDVQLTEAIRALAASLDHHPIKIYNWVHDHIDFLPTYGSIQGAHLTWLTKRGNAFDTASLLIALLRAANIHARYVYGTVQMPIAQVMNWVGGVTTPEAALQLLGQGGIPHTAVLQGGTIAFVKLEHVWVEAWVDFEPSRGAIHRVGDTWIPLDAAFKQYRTLPGMDIPTQVPFDALALLTQATQGGTIQAEEGLVQGLHQANINALLTAYQERVVNVITAQKANATVDEVLGSRQIIPSGRPVLAAGLPYTLIVRGPTWSALPASLRHHLTLALLANTVDQALETPTWEQTLSLPALQARRLGVTYEPATEADRHVMAQAKQQGATTLPAYLIRVRPVLQIDGVTVATGPIEPLGQRHLWRLTLRDPLGHHTGAETFPGSAGDELVIGINGNGLPQTVLEARFAQGPSATAAENLYTLSLCYWLLQDLADQMAARSVGVVAQRLPSVGLFAVPLRVQWLFGIPYKGSYRARRMDVARALLAVAGATPAQAVAFRQRSGWQGAALEGAVMDMVFDHPMGTSTSAVQVLREANAQGIPLYTLTAQTLPGALPHLQFDADVQEEIRTAVAAGHIVFVPAREVVQGSWRGVGYVIQDPATGAGAYLIQGGFNGGEEGGCHDDSLEPLVQTIVGVVFTLSVMLLVMALVLAFAPWVVASLPVLAPQLATASVFVLALAWDVLPAVAAPVPVSAELLWKTLFEARYGPLLTQPPYPADGLPRGVSPNCAPEETASRNSIIHAVCDNSALGGKTCKTAAQSKNCGLAAQCAQNLRLCIELRLALMFECFVGGDEGHWQQIMNKLNALRGCMQCMARNRCTQPFP